MQTVGSYLKSSREAKNISLSDISQHTKISKWYLDCLEKDDLKDIPGGPYIKGYISSYAAFVGIDEDEAIERYISTHSESKLANEADTNIGKKTWFQSLTFNSKKISFLSFALIAMILLPAVIYHFIFQGSGDTKLQKTYGNHEQKEYQTSKNQMIKLTPARPELKQTNSNIEKTAPPKNLEGPANVLPEPIINQQSTEKIPKSRADLETLNTETPPLNTNSLSQKVQIPPNAEDGIKVVKAVAGRGIQDRDPIGTGNSFQWSNERVYI